MQSKLKNQANKMRGAKNKLAAVNAFAGVIEESKSPSPRDRDDGYN